MTEPADGSLSTVSWFESFLHHIRYGITLIRRDGLVYFFKRLYQFTTSQLMTAYQSFRTKLSPGMHGELIEIDDVHPTTQLEVPGPGSLPSFGSTTSDHNQLVLQSFEIHARLNNERERIAQLGRSLFAGRKVLFVAPIRVLGGGANLIFQAAAAMRRMDIDAQILNLKLHRRWFEKNYPHLELPVIFVDVEDIPKRAQGFDAVIATSNPTVSWIAPARALRPSLVVGYYIQDYEPYFYPQGTYEYQKAYASYTLIPNLVRMVTTPWIASQLDLSHHISSVIVGGHLDVDLFQPHPRKDPSWPDRPLRITAMIRPSTPRRSPVLTMAVLQQIAAIYSTRLQIRLFGCDHNDPGFAALDPNFRYQIAGQLRSTQVANLFNEADIFVDFSEFQAFGLTALEAMACGMAVIVPASGGTSVYVEHEKNCLVVDTRDQSACYKALQQLIEDDSLRKILQSNAISTPARFFAERSAFNMMDALFEKKND